MKSKSCGSAWSAVHNFKFWKMKNSVLWIEMLGQADMDLEVLCWNVSHYSPFFISVVSLFEGSRNQICEKLHLVWSLHVCLPGNLWSNQSSPNAYSTPPAYAHCFIFFSISWGKGSQFRQHEDLVYLTIIILLVLYR